MAAKKKTDGQQDKNAEGALKLPVIWHTSEAVTTRYANQAVVQSGPSECYVSFFEIQPPFAGQEGREEPPKSVQANCVARIVIPKEFLPHLIEVLQNLAKKQEALKGNSDQQRNGKGD